VETVNDGGNLALEVEKRGVGISQLAVPEEKTFGKPWRDRGDIVIAERQLAQRLLDAAAHVRGGGHAALEEAGPRRGRQERPGGMGDVRKCLPILRRREEKSKRGGGCEPKAAFPRVICPARGS
jgi:hypothetical protein